VKGGGYVAGVCRNSRVRFARCRNCDLVVFYTSDVLLSFFIARLIVSEYLAREASVKYAEGYYPRSLCGSNAMLEPSSEVGYIDNCWTTANRNLIIIDRYSVFGHRSDVFARC